MRQTVETNRNQTNGAHVLPFTSERVRMSSEEFQAIGEIGAMFYEQGNLDKAQTIFEGLIEIDPESGAAHSAFGALLTKLRDDENALFHLNKAVELNDAQIAPFVNRAEVYLRQQRFEAAVADLKRAIELDPTEKDAGANRARAMVLGIHQAIESQKEQQK
ncbi:MAG TPA: tetratricopeptide repeat protein [Pyrinomonadaceae bacterium]|jgi:tetratricopeptide (TPR) repeat protein